MSDISVYPVPRSPRLRVLLDGTTEIAPFYVDIAHTASGAAATFSISLPIARQPDLPMEFWLGVAQPEIQIQVALDSQSDYLELISGLCDTVHINPVGGIVRLQGRGRAASLLDTKSSIVYQNRTSSEIAVDLASRHGLTPAVAATMGYVGRYYADETQVSSLVQFSKLASDWDILVFLAQQENFNLYVTGSTLNFQPRGAAYQTPAEIAFGSLMELQISRTLSLSSGVDTVVQSWDSASQTHVAAFGRVGSSSSVSAAARTYSFIKPNITSQMADLLATQIASDIFRNAIRLTITMPGTSDLIVGTPIRLIGLPTLLNQVFEIESIKRSFRAKSGFVQSITAFQLAT